MNIMSDIPGEEPIDFGDVKRLPPVSLWGYEILGMPGDDSLLGTEGADFLNGGLGADWTGGGRGNDRYVVENVRDVVAEWAGQGLDAVYSHIDYTLGNNVERLMLLGFNELRGIGNRLDNLMEGNRAGNWLRGGDGDDKMFGHSGNDNLGGGSGDDILRGGADTDKLKGGDGTDTLLGGSGGDVLTDHSGGKGRGNLLKGEQGNDDLSGGKGNETLVGGEGVDKLKGGGGADVYVLDSAVGADRIVDFALKGKDVLSISQASLPIGDGDTVIDVAARKKHGGFDTSAELVIITGDIKGKISAESAADAIGSAKSAYAVGQTVLFAVDNGTNSALYYFKSADNDALVSADELTLLAKLQGTASTLDSDYAFGA